MARKKWSGNAADKPRRGQNLAAPWHKWGTEKQWAQRLEKWLLPPNCDGEGSVSVGKTVGRGMKTTSQWVEHRQVTNLDVTHFITSRPMHDFKGRLSKKARGLQARGFTDLESSIPIYPFLFRREFQKPLLPTGLGESAAVHLQLVRLYAPHLHRCTFLASKPRRKETQQYTVVAPKTGHIKAGRSDVKCRGIGPPRSGPLGCFLGDKRVSRRCLGRPLGELLTIGPFFVLFLCRGLARGLARRFPQGRRTQTGTVLAKLGNRPCSPLLPCLNDCALRGNFGIPQTGSLKNCVASVFFAVFSPRALPLRGEGSREEGRGENFPKPCCSPFGNFLLLPWQHNLWRICWSYCQRFCCHLGGSCKPKQKLRITRVTDSTTFLQCTGHQCRRQIDLHVLCQVLT